MSLSLIIIQNYVDDQCNQIKVGRFFRLQKTGSDNASIGGDSLAVPGKEARRKNRNWISIDGEEIQCEILIKDTVLAYLVGCQ